MLQKLLLTSRFVSGHRNHQVLGPGSVIRDCMTVAVLAIDAKRELDSVHCHLRTDTPHGGQAPSGASPSSPFGSLPFPGVLQTPP
jgi:hypothetical protein